MMTMLCEEQSTLKLRDAASKYHSYDAQSPIQLPDAGRALPPISSSSSSSSASSKKGDNDSGGGGGAVATTIPARVKDWALALLLGRALPPAPTSFNDASTAPVAWHCHQPRLATVDAQGRILIYSDPAGPGVSGSGGDVTMKPPAVLRHSLHAGTRAMSWRPNAGATLAVVGSHGVCVWSHEPGHGGGLNGGDGAGGGGGAAAGAAAAVKKFGSRGRIGGAPEWKLRRLRDVDDGGGSLGEDPFAAAAISGASRVVDTLRRIVPRALRGGGAAGGTSASSSAAAGISSFWGSSGGGGADAYDAVAWSPCGRLLAAAGASRRAVSVWDLSTGECTKISSGVGGVSLLRWSPCGAYLFAAHPHGGFTLWETEGWTSAGWETDGAPVSAAAWGPGGASTVASAAAGGAAGSAGEGAGAVVLVTTRGGGGQVLAVHLPQGAPSLVAQLLPLDLPQLTAGGEESASGGGEGGGGGGGNSAAGGKSGGGGALKARPLDIVSMSWDPSGKRLAVVLDSAPRPNDRRPPTFTTTTSSATTAKEGKEEEEEEDEKGPHRPGRVVLYSMRVSPVVSASLLGYISPESDDAATAAAAATSVSSPTGPGGPARAAVLSGPGGGRCGGRSDAGSTLAVCWEGGGVSVCPLYFPLAR